VGEPKLYRARAEGRSREPPRNAAPDRAENSADRPELGRIIMTLRPIHVTPDYLKYPEGSCLFQMGNTKVLCAVSISTEVPDHAKESLKGWLSAEYSMLPRATNTRSQRNRIASGG